jgi:hypothetical protein
MISLGLAGITFKTQEDALRAMHTMNRTKVKGVEIICRMPTEKDQVSDSSTFIANLRFSIGLRRLRERREPSFLRNWRRTQHCLLSWQ